MVPKYWINGVVQYSNRKYSAKFKAKVALAAIRNKQTTFELSKYYSVPHEYIHIWKQALLEEAHSIFCSDRNY